MKCLKCDGAIFREDPGTITQEIRNKIISVQVPCFICAGCGSNFMHMNHVSFLRRSTTDEYRRSEGLLTSIEILKYRKLLGMSQLEFASFLNIGLASIKRWETYYIQDQSQDQHIRLKCDLEIARVNFLELHWRLRKTDIYSGKKKFSFELFKQVVLFFVMEGNVSKSVLNRLLFYIDFLHFKKHVSGITGSNYLSGHSGPYPNYYEDIFLMLERDDTLVQKGVNKISYSTEVSPNLSIFSRFEIETMKLIKNYYLKNACKAIQHLSVRENGFLKTQESSFISYKYARDLLI